MSIYTDIGFTQVPMGTIVAFGLHTNYKPQGWLLCDGSMIPRNYKALIDALGDCVPDLRARTLIGTGIPINRSQSDYTLPNFEPSIDWTLGYTGGESKHILTGIEVPSHNHQISLSFSLPDSLKGEHAFSVQTEAVNASSNSTNVSIKSSTDYYGGNGYHNTMQPYYVVNYIIYAGVSI